MLAALSIDGGFLTGAESANNQSPISQLNRGVIGAPPAAWRGEARRRRRRNGTHGRSSTTAMWRLYIDEEDSAHLFNLSLLHLSIKEKFSAKYAHCAEIGVTRFCSRGICIRRIHGHQ